LHFKLISKNEDYLCADGLPKDCLLLPRIDVILEKLTWAKKLARCPAPWQHSGLCNDLQMFKQLMKFILQGISYAACNLWPNVPGDVLFKVF
jgi:hypothetical protein